MYKLIYCIKYTECVKILLSLWYKPAGFRPPVNGPPHILKRGAIAKVHPVYVIKAEQRRSGRQPLDNRLSRMFDYGQQVNYIHRHHLLLLLNPKADTVLTSHGQ